MLRTVVLVSVFTSVAGNVGSKGIPWPFTKYPAERGRRIRDPSEVVHFFSVGDWGSQPYEALGMNGGSMHNSCRQQREARRCQPNSEEWAREENAQQRVAKQMLAVAKRKPISWVVNVGDNFYFDGVDSTYHWHWRTSFENMYSDPAFHVPWFSVLGNHDYGGDCCAMDLFGGAKETAVWLGFAGRARPTVQFDYDTEHEWQWPAEKARRWVMPFFNWTKVVDLGPYKVQFFAIDTNVADIAKQCVRCGGCSNSGTHPAVLALGCTPDSSSPGGQCSCFMHRLWSEQLNFLERQLVVSSRDSSIAWRFLIGHHPWNFLPRGRHDGLDRFLQLLKQYNVQVHFSGHVHSMRHDVMEDTLDMVMTGSSGGYQYDSGPAPPGDVHGKTVWSSHFMDYGFAHMEMTQSQLRVNYINDNGDLRKTIVIPARRESYNANNASGSSLLVF